ncbi:bifunctional ADP-dependent (S)-NAD(P)H-hydrate dehydratase/NAD(P)H-hydrate epimerase [Halioglobus sp. HI00S01]|uniref:bifunctional ADP-dependent NAD(P)H-hydrate dehydratase/NAD(P)H-hydrate epimerase n=1 Tax=Halioglobus sp. HI00S01 TaxID=1822214 RepID=UPI0007C39467|nr:bifunctional ADP-dependent NAD(P)H-hydrate dehydratase/NAD(P)H-hydrate epimerase [Halioglobus sp. HI00S01]KZX58595.1 bifunctional ADP-dependent (S)-NAD(P)H-hydrate dehydratase/NAD(P)H-hydrate epimerase [Halioglobus sp. HI00S01]
MDLSYADRLYTAEQTRALDRSAIDGHRVPGITLMSRAAHATFDAMLDLWPEPEQVQVLCGTGNNGGDGFLIADLALKRGIPVVVYQLGDAAKISGDALLARQQAEANGVDIQPFEDTQLIPLGIVVDAMLGTGLGGDVRGPYVEAIETVNAVGVPVVAVDIPSGLCADTGRVLGCAVVADLTVTFIGMKRGLFTAAAPDYVGELQFDDLMVPPEIYLQVDAGVFGLDVAELLETLPHRPANAHKGMYGTVLVVGGDYGMAGAAALAAEAALRCGAGLVQVATRPEHVSALVARAPEVMPIGVESGDNLAPMLAAADVIVVGPGLGQSDWSRILAQAALASGKPLVLDADVLNLLAAGELTLIGTDHILTPHPGEAARLLDCANAEVQHDRFASARALQEKLGGVVVLKGNGTLITGTGPIMLSDYGNPGMASGGMGDVLSGVIGSFVAQGLEFDEAAALGVCLHGAAADLAAEDGMHGLLASDLMPWLRELLE